MKSVFFVILIIFFSTTLQAQVLIIASLQDACDYALKHNPDQKSYILNVEKAKTDFRTSESYLLPSVVGTFNGQINTSLATTALPGEIFGKPGKTIDAQLGQKYNYTAGLTATKNLFDWQSFVQMRIAKNNFVTTQLQTEAYNQSLKQQVAQYYFAAIISQEALKAYQQDLAVADSTVLLTNQKLQQGLINVLTANQSVINRNNIQQQIVTTEILSEQCNISLKLLLGIDANAQLQIKSIDIENKDQIPSTQNIGFDKNLSVLENQMKATALKVNLQKSAFAPKISLNAYLGNQQYRNDFGMSFTDGAWHPVSYIGLNIQLPLFTGFANFNKLQSSKIDYQKIQNDWNESKRKSTYNDELLIFEFKQSQVLIKSSADNYQLFAQNRKLAAQQMKEGIISIDTYFKFFDDYLKSENVYLNALSQMFTYYATIFSRQ